MASVLGGRRSTVSVLAMRLRTHRREDEAEEADDLVVEVVAEGGAHEHERLDAATAA